MSAILEVDHLVKKYGDFEAVKGVSFAVEEGEVFGLLGPNGAGKTTTISMVTGEGAVLSTARQSSFYAHPPKSPANHPLRVMTCPSCAAILRANSS